MARECVYVPGVSHAWPGMRRCSSLAESVVVMCGPKSKGVWVNDPATITDLATSVSTDVDRVDDCSRCDCDIRVPGHSRQK